MLQVPATRGAALTSLLALCEQVDLFTKACRIYAASARCSHFEVKGLRFRSMCCRTALPAAGRVWIHAHHARRSVVADSLSATSAACSPPRCPDRSYSLSVPGTWTCLQHRAAGVCAASGDVLSGTWSLKEEQILLPIAVFLLICLFRRKSQNVQGNVFCGGDFLAI